jgi:hypothetical protein
MVDFPQLGITYAGPGGSQQPFLWDNKYYLSPACTP